MSDPERPASRTALGVAALRAAHLLLDARPSILDDPVSLTLLDPGAREAIEGHAEHFQSAEARALRTHVVLRSRYAEDRLHAATVRGVRQLVVLGAGLDTFAYRQPVWAGDLRVFEVDQPASQHLKRERLARAGVPLPTNLTFVPIDFETTGLAAGLQGSGFDPARPTFVSWLGVMTYLTPDAVEAVFRWVASLPASSELVFTFSQPRAHSSPLAERARALGEPWLTHVTPEQLTAQLLDLGFTRVELLTPEAAEARYLSGRADALPIPRRASTASALV